MFELEKRLEKRKIQGNFRTLPDVSQLIDFASNDYLGFARSPELIQSVLRELGAKAQMGSTGSRLLTGNSLYVQELETKIAAFHGFEAGLLFGSGYMANIGLFSSIAQDGDLLFFDAHIHASIGDGIKLSGAKAFPFRHNDLEHLEKRLKHLPGKNCRFICIEAIYSTDGSMAPLDEIIWLAKRHDAHVIVDEAHAVGLYGPNGEGLVKEKNLTSHIFAQISTFGKALGAEGAIVLGSRALKSFLINFARPFIYTTAPSFFTLSMVQCGYELLPSQNEARRQLFQLIHLFKKEGFSSSVSAIQSIEIPGNERVKAVCKKFVEEGFDVRCLLSPTVQKGHERVRLCFHAFNTNEEVKSLIKTLRGCL